MRRTRVSAGPMKDVNTSELSAAVSAAPPVRRRSWTTTNGVPESSAARRAATVRSTDSATSDANRSPQPSSARARASSAPDGFERMENGRQTLRRDMGHQVARRKQLARGREQGDPLALGHAFGRATDARCAVGCLACWCDDEGVTERSVADRDLVGRPPDIDHLHDAGLGPDDCRPRAPRIRNGVRFCGRRGAVDPILHRQELSQGGRHRDSRPCRSPATPTLAPSQEVRTKFIPTKSLRGPRRAQGPPYLHMRRLNGQFLAPFVDRTRWPGPCFSLEPTT